MGQILTLSQPAIDLVLFGNKSNILNNYLVRQIEQIHPTFNEFSERIYNTLQSSWNFINDKMTQYGIMSQLSQNGVQAVDNYFMECLTFQQLQEANYTMQRWIMCHPTLRELYIDQNIDGYSNTYKNFTDKGIAEEDYNYRRLMDSVLISNNDDHWKVNYYLEDLVEGDKELDHYEKVKILNTHDAIDWLLDNCKFDFTSTSTEPPKINRE